MADRPKSLDFGYLELWEREDEISLALPKPRSQSSLRQSFAMNDPMNAEDEIVDLDTCSKRKSILIAVAITAVLGFVPYSYPLLCGHFFLGGFAAAGHFAKLHRITISFGRGAKMGSLSAFLGMAVAFPIVFAFPLLNTSEEAWQEMADSLSQSFYERGQPEAVEVIQKALPPENIGFVVFSLFILLSVFAVLLGALGGGLGASLFKKGPQAL